MGYLSVLKTSGLAFCGVTAAAKVKAYGGDNKGVKR